MRRTESFCQRLRFDLLHSGHIRFIENAAKYGDVYVAIGSDRTVAELKGRPPVTSETERQYMLESVKHVKQCVISRGRGLMDFVDELLEIKPDIFKCVNIADGSTPPKVGIVACKITSQYVVLEQDPRHDFCRRARTTSLRQECSITPPVGITRVAGCLTSALVSKLCAGPVITISLGLQHSSERAGAAWPRLPGAAPISNCGTRISRPAIGRNWRKSSSPMKTRPAPPPLRSQ